MSQVLNHLDKTFILPALTSDNKIEKHTRYVTFSEDHEELIQEIDRTTLCSFFVRKPPGKMEAI